MRKLQVGDLNSSVTHRVFCARAQFQRSLLLKTQFLPLHSSAFWASSLSWLLLSQLFPSLLMFPTLPNSPTCPVCFICINSLHCHSSKIGTLPVIRADRKAKKRNGQGATELRQIMRSDSLDSFKWLGLNGEWGEEATNGGHFIYIIHTYTLFRKTDK